MSLPLDIETTVVEVDSLSLEVPALLVDCFSFIATEGLVEGIFRVSGSVRRIREVSQDFNAYKSWLHSGEKSPNAHDVCGVIKSFLREYGLSMNGIFSSSVSQSLKKLYLLLTRKGSSASSYSCASTASALSAVSSLPDIDETNVIETPRTLNVQQFLSSSAQMFLSKNWVKKNELVLYLVHMLHELLKQVDVTKMPPENLSIIFQPYVFTSSSISDLQVFQEILTVFILNQKTLADEYSKYYKVLGGLDETEADAISITSLDSPYKSSSTDFSSVQASPTNKAVAGVPEVSRRFSLSQRISSLWENYNSPLNKPKRLSFISRASDKSNDDLVGGASLCPQESVKSLESLSDIFPSTMKFSKDAGPAVHSLESPPSLSLEVSDPGALALSQESSAKRPSRRMSILNSLRSIGSSIHESDKAEKNKTSCLPMGIKGKSVDDLLLSTKGSGMVAEKRNLMKRRLSLWIKKD